MAYCSKCGKEVEKSGKFCTYCGAEIKFDGMQQDSYSQKTKPGREKNTSNSIIITGMICVTVIIVVIAVVFILNMFRLPESGQKEPASLPSEASNSEQEESDVWPSEMPEREQDSQEDPKPEMEEDIPLKEWSERDTLPFFTENFSMELPGTWVEHYSLEKGEDFYAFYNVENADAGYGGFLFSIETYQKDGEWEYLPSYQFLKEKDGTFYVATFPTDVQFDIENEENQEIYKEMREDIDGILATFALK